MLRNRGRVCRLGTPPRTRSIGILALVISALVQPALSEDPQLLASAFLISIRQGGAFIRRFKGDDVLFVRISGRFFEPSDVCHASCTAPSSVAASSAEPILCPPSPR